MSNQTRKLFIWPVLALSVVINIYFIINNNRDRPIENEMAKYDEFPFLSKRIFAQNQNDILINFIPLRHELRKYVENAKNQLGVYFEYLPSGTSIGVNDNMEVRLASLIKIPIVMAIYKQIESGNISKDTMLTISESSINKEFGDLWKKGVGYKITVEDAINLSLIKSDNTAARVLVSALPDGAIDNVFDSLDIPKDKNQNLPIISPKNYSSILRSLYLSSYLTKDHSNEILEILSKTNFTDRLAAGVPANTKISHKIGVYDTDNIFSDCGIIYPKGRPYLVCVMVKADESTAIQQIELISKMIYGYVIAVNN